MIKITKQLVSEDRYYLKCPYEMVPTRIVVHNTANDASARNEISYMTNNAEETSFHYAVDDKEIVQGIHENRNAWHAGDGNGKGNREGIAIEICYSKSGGDRFTKAENNAVDLIVDILNRYSWDIDKVTKHQDYSGKYCPHRTLDLGWDRFINNIREKLSQTRERPFIIGTIVYNTEDLYLHETAGYGGKDSLLKKDTKSIVKKYHYNNGLYMALGEENSYYDTAWTNEYHKFTTETPIIQDTTTEDTPKEEIPENKDNDEIKDTEETNNNIQNEDNNIEIKEEDIKETTEKQTKQNPLLWLINKIIETLKKLFKGKINFFSFFLMHLPNLIYQNGTANIKIVRLCLKYKTNMQDYI